MYKLTHLAPCRCRAHCHETLLPARTLSGGLLWDILRLWADRMKYRAEIASNITDNFLVPSKVLCVSKRYRINRQSTCWKMSTIEWRQRKWLSKQWLTREKERLVLVVAQPDRACTRCSEVNLNGTEPKRWALGSAKCRTSQLILSKCECWQCIPWSYYLLSSDYSEKKAGFQKAQNMCLFWARV